jgi:transcriptional regulator with XRE-family HTH domain
VDPSLQKKQEIADRIRTLLKKKGWKQQDLVRESGLGKGYVSDLLHCKHNPTVEMIVELETVLGGPIITVPKRDRTRQAP